MQKTERFEMRLDQETILRVDEWRWNQSERPSRAEAMRRLVGVGLMQQEPSTVRLSTGEKLIISLLSGMARGENRFGIDPTLVCSMIETGDLWALEWQYPDLFTPTDKHELALHEVCDILDMWRRIEWSYADLNDHDKELLRVEAAPFGDADDMRFAGFDVLHEGGHLGVASFLVDKLGRYKEFKGRDLVSDSISLHRHRQMLSAYEPISEGLRGRLLNVKELIEISTA